MIGIIVRIFFVLIALSSWGEASDSWVCNKKIILSERQEIATFDNEEKAKEFAMKVDGEILKTNTSFENKIIYNVLYKTFSAQDNLFENSTCEAK